MVKEELKYNFFYWGPLLFRCKVSPEDIKKFKKLCVKDKSLDHRHNLAGVIDDEYAVDLNDFAGLIGRYMKAYAHAFQSFYGFKCDGGFNIEGAWVNYMKPGDGNPIHIHEPCDLSSVLYLDVPTAIHKEQELWKGKGAGPGGITFFNQPPTPGWIAQNVFRPVTGDLFIFPALLPHSVAPFTSKCERVSMAANFKYKVPQGSISGRIFKPHNLNEAK